MNWIQSSIALPQAAHTGLDKCLSWFVVLSLKSFVGILELGFQQLFDTLEEPLDKTLRFRTSLSQQGSRMGLGSFALSCT
jgi:hypothetical protein